MWLLGVNKAEILWLSLLLRPSELAMCKNVVYTHVNMLISHMLISELGFFVVLQRQNCQRDNVHYN